MLDANISLQIDYAKDGKYALMIGDAFAPSETYYFDTVQDAFKWVNDTIGDTPVELSQSAHLILTIELGVDHDTNFNG